MKNMKKICNKYEDYLLGLISRLCKEILQVSKTTTVYFLKNRSRDRNRHFTEEKIQMAN